ARHPRRIRRTVHGHPDRIGGGEPDLPQHRGRHRTQVGHADLKRTGSSPQNPSSRAPGKRVVGSARCQLPGRPWADGKNGSFQLSGRVLMTPVLYICSAYFITPFGVRVKAKPGLAIISTSSSTVSFSLLALR